MLGASGNRARTNRRRTANYDLGVRSSNLFGRASLRDIPCESHGIHTATYPANREYAWPISNTGLPKQNPECGFPALGFPDAIDKVHRLKL